jgi:hypothetical protein
MDGTTRENPKLQVIQADAEGGRVISRANMQSIGSLFENLVVGPRVWMTHKKTGRDPLTKRRDELRG